MLISKWGNFFYSNYVNEWGMHGFVVRTRESDCFSMCVTPDEVQKYIVHEL